MLRLLTVLFAALPIGFATARAITTGWDLRYLWVAIASSVGAVLVGVLWRGREQSHGAIAFWLVALGVSTLCGALMAFALGTNIGLGMLIVTMGFGACFSTSLALPRLARHSNNPSMRAG